MLTTTSNLKGEFLYINRTFASTNQQQGFFTAIDKNGVPVLTGVTLELPNRNNARKVSQIPCGTYACFKTMNSKNKAVIHIMGVASRDGIQIHSGNFHTDIQGCILVGSHFQHLNSDEDIDVVNSAETLRNLLKRMNDKFFLQIS